MAMADLPFPGSPQAQVARLLAALEADGLAPEALQAGLAELARWRLGCGDLQGAARLQRLALAAHQPAAIRAALERLWADGDRPVPATAAASAPAPAFPEAWAQLLRLLHRGHYRQASALQAQLLQALADPAGRATPPEPEQRSALQAAWLQAGWGEQAVALQAAVGGEGPAEADGAGLEPELAAALAWWARDDGGKAAVTESEAARWGGSRSTDPS